MCEAVFRDLRSKERSRVWTLQALVEFWVAVVLRAPKSLREAIEESRAGRLPLPVDQPSRSSFCERSQHLRWEFFREVFERFVECLLPECPPSFEGDLRSRLSAFPEVWVVDSSGLDRVARKLKAVRRVPEVVIPGSVLAVYDLFRGLPRALHFHEKLLGGDAGRLRDVLAEIPRGTLLVSDRGFSSVRLLAEIGASGLHGVIRLKSNVLLSDAEELGRFVDEGAEVADRLATVGSGQRAPKTRVRIVEKKLPDGEVLRLAVTVTEPRSLPAKLVLDLYRRRWAIEQMFQHLKEVLNLRRFYGANTNAVAMQVYASAIVYAALRATQARIAADHKRRPEELSTAKLFPRLAAAHFRLVATMEGYELARRLNPRARLAEPDWGGLRLYEVSLSHLLVTKRSGPRRRPRYSPRRKLMVSLQRYERRKRPRGQGP
jgi:hypothetical protein